MDSGLDEIMVFNGINGSSGKPLLPALSAQALTRLACGERWDREHLAELDAWHEALSRNHWGTRRDVAAERLEEAGWGVVFAKDTPEAVHEALRPLLELRRAQATARDERLYRELTYLPGESKLKFLARHGVGTGAVDPKHLPYYLLLVGGPEAMPFTFQYQLDVQYAVGRLDFETPEEYARYAATVVAAESGRLRRERRATFFGVANVGDRATQSSREQLVEPLAERLEKPGWSVERLVEADATKANLGAVLDGERAPALLFSASHGLGFDADDPRQLSHQGALLCQDWPGLKAWREPIPEEHYFAAHDVATTADPSGLVAFFFACYGAGTPRHDEIASGHDGKGDRLQLAPHDFVARLPQRLLGHPKGGALAVVGHVDRAWSYSFNWPRAVEQLTVFEDALAQLLCGNPIGFAMESFNQRYAELSSDLGWEREAVQNGKTPDFMSLASLWTANNDARSYIVLGDPAVRLAVPGAGPASDS